MHSPRPYGLAVEGGELTNQDRLFIDSIAKKVSNFKQISQLESLRYTRALPDGGFVIVYDMGGVFKAIAYKEQVVDKPVEEGIAILDVPMLFSGVINDGRAFDGKGVSLNLTEMCCRRLERYSGGLASKNQKLQRFSIKFSQYFQELKPEIASMIAEDKVLYSQYTAQYPTWYSGTMAEVMQIVAGYGKQKFENLPDNNVERAVFNIPNKYLERIKPQFNDVRLPGYTGKPNQDGEFQYSYTFNKTNLVSFDEENNPWLIQIEPNNVWAMPLPMIPATTTQEFREYIEEVGDHELESILNRFGGLPSGEGFPTQNVFHSWVRAGVIIKVCGTSDFYHYSAYTSACGWSCNSNGTEIVNTCFDLKDIFFYGYTYMLKLDLGVARKRGVLEKRTVENLSVSQLQNISKYISSLHRLMQELGDSRLPCIMYKLRLVQLSEVLAKATGDATEADIAYWDQRTLEPIANHTGEVVRTNEGYLYHGLALKLPEPLLKACVSMDWIPQTQDLGYIHPKCDTISFAYYIGDEIKVIKSFYDDRKHINEVEGNFEDVMIVGSWEQVTTVGLASLNGAYYSTDFDDRKELSPVKTTTKIMGTDLGYTKPSHAFDYYFWRPGTIFRDRYYSHKIDEVRVDNEFFTVGYVVPYFARNIAIYALKSGSDGGYTSEEVKLLSVRDPNQYRMWTETKTYDNEVNDFGGLPVMKGTPEPRRGRPVWAEIHEYHNNTESSWFADEGEWLPGLPFDVSKMMYDDKGKPNVIWSKEDITPPPSVYEYKLVTENEPTQSGFIKASLLDKSLDVSKIIPNDFFFTRSPDSWGNFLYQDACKVVFGTSTYANISIYGELNKRHRFGYTKLADHQSAHFFIGVINE